MLISCVFEDPGLAVAGDLYSPKGHSTSVSYIQAGCANRYLMTFRRTIPSQDQRCGQRVMRRVCRGREG